jgi:hypothetical protein
MIDKECRVNGPSDEETEFDNAGARPEALVPSLVKKPAPI